MTVMPLTVHDLPLAERPRERLSRLGPDALSDQELLACVLGRGVAGESVLVNARRLLAQFGSWRGVAEASVDALGAVHGIGPAKAAQLKAAAELARRLASVPGEPRPCIDSFEAAVAAARPRLDGQRREHVIALLLDTRHGLIRVAPIAVGTLSASLVHPREVFTEAISASAAALILAHNHPSGDPSPSEADLALTRRLIEAGRIVGIEVLDHIILGRPGAASLRALGAWPTQRPATRRGVLA